MTNENLRITKEQQALFQLLATTLFSAPFTPQAGIDWSKLMEEAHLQSVVLSAFNAADPALLDEEGTQKLKRYGAKQTLRNIRNRQAHTHLHRLMSRAGIPYCVLKGVASAHYYPDPLLRHMGDVDFYVDQRNLERAVAILLEDGFEEKYKNQENNHHRVFMKPGMHYEMHFEVAGVPEGAAGAKARACFEKLCAEAITVNYDGANCAIPSPFHHGLIILLHLQHHLTGGGVGLRHLCDWAVFVDHFKGDEFEQAFKAPLSAIGLWKFARIISLAASLYIGLPRQGFMEERDAPLAHAIMAEILSGGNFGRKNQKLQYEGMIISVAGRDGSEKSFLRRGIEGMNRIVRAYWPIVKKIPLLYPFGWIFFCIRYIARMISGRRPTLHFSSLVGESRRRRALYASLELFKADQQ